MPLSSKGKVGRVSSATIAGIVGLVATLIAFAAAPSAVAQHDPQGRISEVIRKAQAGEAEDGFCRTTRWRVESPQTVVANTAFYDRGRVGSAKTFLNAGDDADPYCAYLRIEGVFSEAGRRCVRVQMWACTVGKSCVAQVATGCRGARIYEWR